ncbi:glycoside hydrolase family 68 protein [Arthrobacter sp. ISL-65]|uniref:glycoside hydrolase family 68 protein n=1 Tax=Arthrobacter sp. ISL-65 TaxID=2819112 RepID=UPI001BEA9AF4|nr:glycoside hydrolase family 68 protein [Arthrobacter sp. ISL-65]MBT2550813.1 glycoside hydrolase family 68 protein [Arthrobacter sp. ISL-65]
MVFRLKDSWVWDFWLADDGASYHMYYLHAPKSLGDPELRHSNARIGHATSTDLRTWEPQGVVLEPDDPDAFDATSTWTGSVVQGQDGTWRMFYTGARFYETHNIEAIGVATSPDLRTWTKQRDTIIEADARWYERYGDSTWPEEAWRDPWVFADPAGDGWHMLITARANTGDVDNRGVIGHARSQDLLTWSVMPPLSSPGAGFAHVEVPQTTTIDGRNVLFFSCGLDKLSATKAPSHQGGGIWSLEVGQQTGPYDLAASTVITPAALYSGRLIQDRAGQWMMMACHDANSDGSFEGIISDPMPVHWDPARASLTTTPGPNHDTDHRPVPHTPRGTACPPRTTDTPARSCS